MSPFRGVATPGSDDAFDVNTTNVGDLTVTAVAAVDLGSYTEPEARAVLLLGRRSH